MLRINQIATHLSNMCDITYIVIEMQLMLEANGFMDARMQHQTQFCQRYIIGTLVILLCM